jgi:hypothetical protein
MFVNRDIPSLGTRLSIGFLASPLRLKSYKQIRPLANVPCPRCCHTQVVLITTSQAGGYYPASNHQSSLRW